MSIKTKLSVLGLYNWDDTLFDGMKLPDVVDKDDLIHNLLMEVAELTVLYTDSDFMKKAITSWSSIRLHSWNRIAEVLYEDYQPFINIKRDEIRTIIQEGEGSANTKVNAWETETPQEQNSTDTNSKTKTTETFHVEGDSAITDAQDVLQKEIEARLKYDLYRIIIDEFRQRFCLLIY